jgi:ABC-type nitrate/sulfonate/bicarbonate transport system permease component
MSQGGRAADGATGNTRVRAPSATAVAPGVWFGGLSLGAPYNRGADAFWRWLFTILIILAWWLGAVGVPSYLMPGPGEVLIELGTLLAEPVLSAHLLDSLFQIFASVMIAFAAGMAFALLAHYVLPTRLLIRHRITPFLNAFSGIGWTLLAVIWFGINPVTVIFAITVNLMPFYIINISQGLDSIERDYLEMGRSFTFSSWRLFIMVTLPLLTPFLFASFRLAFGVSWKIALTAELLGGDRGLGYLMNLAMQDQNTPRIVAIAIFIVFFVYLSETRILNPVQNFFDRRFRAA